jgi:hypothetical protein
MEAPVTVLVHTLRGAETDSVNMVMVPSESMVAVKRSVTVAATCAAKVAQSMVASNCSSEVHVKPLAAEPDVVTTRTVRVGVAGLDAPLPTRGRHVVSGSGGVSTRDPSGCGDPVAGEVVT